MSPNSRFRFATFARGPRGAAGSRRNTCFYRCQTLIGGSQCRSQVANRVSGQALELFGGYGYSREYPVEKFYRDAKIGTIYEGTSNMQLQTIAKAMLK